MAGCHSRESTAPAAVEVVKARVVNSAQQQVAVNIHSTGTVHAGETAVVSAQFAGRIQQVLVREGDSVRAGQALVVIDDAPQRASLDQAMAGVKAAQSEQAAAETDARLAATTLERYRQLDARKKREPPGNG
jgi:multidrug efflux pump subunit AcrA (membrane-fusion protein)